MGLYRRLIYDFLRRKISPVESFCSRSNPTRSRISQPILRNSVLQNVKNSNQKKSPFFDGAAKRFYSADVKKVPMAFKQAYKWRYVIIFSYSYVSLTIIYYSSLETVPYTKRRHFIIVSPNDEKRIAEFMFEQYTSQLKGKILDSDHPVSIRVEKIGRDIIGGLRKGLNKLKDGEQTAHLEGFNWEIFVVDDPTIVNATCLPGGKIVVFTGLLNYLETDAEIATAIGHEVGHAVARHTAEQMSLIFPVSYFSSSLCQKSFEMEADYIGMLITASAGYDPRIAPEMYVKLEEHSPSELDVNLSTIDHITHPHGKERAQLLSQPKVMEEALSIYTEALKEKDEDKKN